MSAVQDWKSVVKSDYFTAAISTGIACLFTNPVEVIKTRLQLQGELSGKSVPKIYKGPFHAAYVIFKNEGILALQKGLTTAILYQVVMNGIRLGSHSSFKQLTGAIDPYSTPFFFFRNLLSGAASGALGAFVASPLFLIKVRMQTQSKNVAVGYQHQYSGVIGAFKEIIQKEGIRGLWRGSDGAILRVSVGSAIQLSTYDHWKHFILKYKVFSNDLAVYASASLLTGLGLVLFMNPVDVVSTRLYNQPSQNGKGLMYTGPFDCLAKTFKSEGFFGFYKGLLTHYLRLGPHTILTFVIWEQIKHYTQRL
eukprot:TRINITY_DN6317_c0_g2_i1.p1 TRINITY_DN6317_c0_g2~~TRINITY_DN6317_c0_g2_i1.p1  ORF type:complete len:308 (+),score=35.94 TRINITY_DN6317_c0_g2_i1:41-964(+)